MNNKKEHVVVLAAFGVMLLLGGVVGGALGSLNAQAAAATLPSRTVVAAKPVGATGIVIGADGKLEIRGAVVTTSATGTINATVTVGSSTVPVVVTVLSNEVDRRFGSNGNFSEIKAGDILMVRGMLTGFGSSISVTAASLRDLSITKKTAMMEDGKMPPRLGQPGRPSLVNATGTATATVSTGDRR